MLRPWARLPHHTSRHPLLAVASISRIQQTPSQRYTKRRHASTTVQEAVTQLSSATYPPTDSLSQLLRLPMEYMHDTLHLPWVWVIPLSALAIRAALYYPITFSTRKAIQRRQAISPLISAHKPWFRSEALTAARRDPRKSLMPRYQAKMRAITAELKKRYACGLWRTTFKPMLQLPIFLQMSWTIREMLGVPGGTIKSFIYTMLGREQATSAETAQQAASGMTAEGLPWAVDLTVADPTGVLSYSVSAIMLSQTLLGMRSVPGGTNMLSRLLVMLSLMIGPLMASAPAGILYYWACSSGLALVTNTYLEWRYPITRVAPCKRPLLNNGLPLNRKKV